MVELIVKFEDKTCTFNNTCIYILCVYDYVLYMLGYQAPNESRTSARLKKNVKRRQPPKPLLPVVVSVMEMGFSRKRIECAITTLGKYIENDTCSSIMFCQLY